MYTHILHSFLFSSILSGTGKMLSKLARIILIAKEVGGVDRVDFNMALNR